MLLVVLNTTIIIVLGWQYGVAIFSNVGMIAYDHTWAEGHQHEKSLTEENAVLLQCVD